MNYITEIKKHMSEKLFNHSIAVAEACEKLAKIYGEEPDRAYTAGILHDIRKEADTDILKREVEEYSKFYALEQTGSLAVSETERETPQLWHAIAGVQFCKNHFGINDTELLSAIRCHTIGKANMTTLEKIVYVADVISADRNYPDVDSYRQLAFKNLNEAVFHILKFYLKTIIRRQGRIVYCTFEAYNFYLRLTGAAYAGKEKT